MKKTVCKLFAMVLALTMALGTMVTGLAWELPEPNGELEPIHAEKRFTDVPQNAWYLQNLNTLVCAGGIDGYADGSFRADDGLQLCQFVKILMAIMYPVGLEQWQDYPIDGQVTWYSPYVGGAREVGLLYGVDCSKTAMESPMDRYTMAKIMINAASVLGEDLEDDGIVKFLIGDYAAIPREYRDDVCSAYACGILAGKNDDGDFCGNDGLTRAEACTVAVRLFDKTARVQSGIRNLFRFTLEEDASGTEYGMVVEVPASWEGRYIADGSIDEDNTAWYEFFCAESYYDYDAAGGSGWLFSVAVSDTPLEFAKGEYFGQVDGQYCYVIYPTDVQFDPNNAASAKEYTELYKDVEKIPVTVSMLEA